MAIEAMNFYASLVIVMLEIQSTAKEAISETENYV